MAISNLRRNGQIRYDVLGKLLLAHREREGVSLREAARVTGISPSTLSRIENNKGMIEAEHVAALARWLNVGIERFVDRPKENLPRVVKAMLLADPKLGTDEADAISATFSTLYRQMTK